MLIRGLGTQLIEWPPALLDGFVRGGLRVVVFDNRDAGLSTEMTRRTIQRIGSKTWRATSLG